MSVKLNCVVLLFFSSHPIWLSKIFNQMKNQRNKLKNITVVDETTQQCKRKTHTDFWLTCFVSKNQSETEPHNSYSAEKAQRSAQRGTTSSTFRLCIRIYGRMHQLCICMCVRACVLSFGLYSYCCCCCFRRRRCCCFFFFIRTHTKLSEHIRART